MGNICLALFGVRRLLLDFVLRLFELRELDARVLAQQGGLAACNKAGWRTFSRVSPLVYLLEKATGS